MLTRIIDLMKKHSKTGVEARFQGTSLGHDAEPHLIKIEGGPWESLEDWRKWAQERARNEAAGAVINTPAPTLNHEDAKAEEKHGREAPETTEYPTQADLHSTVEEAPEDVNMGE
jgi:hypothetical protein